MRRFGFAALVALLLVSPVAAAQQPPLEPHVEQVVVTAHAEAVPFQNLARQVVVITREEIERLPALSVADLLRVASGVDVRARGEAGVQTDFSIRGAAFGQTLVLVDGVRLNDAQSGHHNGDIPVPLEAIDRIEILMGAGSSLYGADAFGGTINIITRREGTMRQASISAGSFGYVEGRAALAGSAAGVHESIAVDAARSSGFEADREFNTLTATSATTFGRGVTGRVSFARKDFGARGFYGPAESTEQTNQTLAAVDGPATVGAWSGTWQTAYRTHGDVFLYDRTKPGPPNEHRTHAVEAAGRLGRALTATTTVTFASDLGADWIRSNNLGAHQEAHAGAAVELQQRLGTRTFIYPALRADAYSTFGRAWSPSLALSTWAGSRVRVRGSVGRAFRVPTFTERFYEDPNNLGTPTLVPEHAWSSDAGIDWLLAAGWTATISTFDRHAQDTIDFVRATPLERWRAANIRRVDTRGLELSAARRFTGGTLLTAQYSLAGASTDPLPLLSKYVLDFAKQSLALSGAATLPAALETGARLSYTRRANGTAYWLADARVGRRVRRVLVFVEGSNLLDSRYQEIAGADMPGRTVRAGVRVE